MTEPLDMPESFRAQLEARLARPLLLDPRSFEATAALVGLKRREAMLSSTDEVPADAPEEDPTEYALDGELAVVRIEGPLSQRAWSCWMFEGDGYDYIAARCRLALADSRARALLLVIDSPGGEVAGCFEAVRQIRASVEASGKPCVAYADEMACSAAYALACCADAIVLPETGTVGSVGVIASVMDRSKALAQAGVAVHFITSGARKADGRSEIPLTDDARAALQSEVDQLAETFFATVARARGMDVKDVRALEAGVRIGPQAVTAKLADRVGSLDDAAALARSMAAPTNVAPALGASTETHDMKQIAEKLGLAASASEKDVLAALEALTARAEAGDKAVEALVEHKREAEARERASLIEGAKAAGVFDAQTAELAAYAPLEKLRAMASSAPRAPRAPLPAKGDDSPKYAGRTWEQLTLDERAEAYQADPALYAALEADAKARKVHHITPAAR